ncbi:MAG: hypothetical protein ACU0BS_00705 [Hasllibacter sp.]
MQIGNGNAGKARGLDKRDSLGVRPMLPTIELADRGALLEEVRRVL